jgi:hypothetical protein
MMQGPHSSNLLHDALQHNALPNKPLSGLDKVMQADEQSQSVIARRKAVQALQLDQET